MKHLKLIIIAFSLMASCVYGDGFGFSAGPFNLQFGGERDGGFAPIQRNVLDDPICYAIMNHKQLEMILQGTENISTKEKKVITKNLIVEPYAFGITKDGKPVLRGNVVNEKLVKEVSLKFGGEKFNEPDKDGKGHFSGMFSSDKNKNIDIRKIMDIHVLENSHFDVPKDYKSVGDPNVHVLCQLPVAQQ